MGMFQKIQIAVLMLSIVAAIAWGISSVMPHPDAGTPSAVRQVSCTLAPRDQDGLHQAIAESVCTAAAPRLTPM